jgi:hypothetical protein
VAPSTWRTGSAALDPRAQWSSNGSLVTGQDTVTASTEGFDAQEKLNWQIGQGFNNTNSMKVAGATSQAQAAVLAFGATDSSTGQWFLPSANELNELCKYAYGLTTGDLKIRCNPSAVGATLKNSVSGDLGGFRGSPYWSSSEQTDSGAAFQTFAGGANFQSYPKTSGGGAGADLYIRPIRAF